MNPSMKDQLKDLTKQHPEIATKKKTHQQKPQKRRTEVLTESDIKSLMGTNQRTLHRGKGGAWK